MSADAKVWQDDNGDWHAIHDGECLPDAEHHGNAYSLMDVIEGVNTCMGTLPITRWELYVYPDGQAGLRGFAW